jgi:Tol biopolymer transport system component
MKIQGVNITGGIRLDPPAAPTPTGPSKFVVGAPYSDGTGTSSGSAYVYNTDGTGEIKITASDAADNDQFGLSVAVSDTKVIVGAPYDDDPTNAGSVYVYNLDGTGEQKIMPSDGAAADLFGCAIAATSTHIVAGARSNDSGKGAVYVYNTDGTGEVKITASDAAVSDFFGFSVAISDTKIVVGARSEGVGGSVYVYNTDGTGEVKITPSDGAVDDYFGNSVAVTDTHIVVGVFGDDDLGGRSGSAYVYNLDGTGEVKITASDGAANDFFGWSVAMSDTKIFVAAFNNGGPGSVYIYNLDGTGEQKITASDGGEQFGRSVAAQGDKIIAGATRGVDGAGVETGAAYIYNTDGTGEVKITPSDGASGDQFGRSVA